MKKLGLIILFILPFAVKAQILPDGRKVMYATVKNGDTIPMAFLSPVNITGYIAPLTAEEKEKYKRLIRNVRITYPYAKQAGSLMHRYNEILASTKSDSKRKNIMKQAEKEIEFKFGAKLKSLTFRQGAILIRLVDRETGSDSYALVKDLRGNFRAFFYQSLGKLFGYNLKTKYNPQVNEEDRIIERIIYAIETNQV